MKYLDEKGKQIDDVIITNRWIKLPIESDNLTIPLDFEHCLVNPRVFEYIEMLENIIGEINLPKLPNLNKVI